MKSGNRQVGMEIEMLRFSIGVGLGCGALLLILMNVRRAAMTDCTAFCLLLVSIPFCGSE